jgi:fructose-1,6-bisphosphatase/sedoheptulose 1,7-bisphosphatase-like protein
LTALQKLEQEFDPTEILVVTFDKNKLNQLHLGRSGYQVIGLSPNMYLRKIISQNLNSVDVTKASNQITSWIVQKMKKEIKHIVLECTNLPPYKSKIQRMTDLEVTDILTCIEAIRPRTINSKFI